MFVLVYHSHVILSMLRIVYTVVIDIKYKMVDIYVKLKKFFDLSGANVYASTLARHVCLVWRHSHVILFTLTRSKVGSDKVAMNFVVDGEIFIKT
jgi:hypothetical protein